MEEPILALHDSLAVDDYTKYFSGLCPNLEGVHKQVARALELKRAAAQAPHISTGLLGRLPRCLHAGDSTFERSENVAITRRVCSSIPRS